MKRYMLDTNMVSYLIRKHPMVSKKIQEMPISSLCISAITEGELLFGLAKLKEESVRLRQVVKEFLSCMDVCPWDNTAAECYGLVRASLVKEGKTLSDLDLLIGSHAIALDATLISHDQAFQYIKDLKLEDWTL